MCFRGSPMRGSSDEAARVHHAARRHGGGMADCGGCAAAVDLVNHRPSTIVGAGSIAGALAGKEATTTIPIVFETGADPGAAGLVPSLGRPGGRRPGRT